VFVLPMAHQFLFDETNSFENVVMEYIKSTKFNQR